MSAPDSPTCGNRNAKNAALPHHPQVARQRHHRPGARRHPLDAGDDRQLAAPHRVDQLARHPREAQQPLRVALEQPRDDVVDVPAAAERPALALQHQRPRPVRLLRCAARPP
jgi:hypothetical protein